ncbi:hypothetical protein S1OALGB6SA_248 [Olavius algarvensis spirochete endosymbiont]|nr:MAG: hypothetical protein [Olavius algarvensis spirochete endosymbiont]VDA99185.1 hypothetical protein S1OALGB6SA_248 [Olavius algarvensis spirochete endosymbiont]
MAFEHRNGAPENRMMRIEVSKMETHNAMPSLERERGKRQKLPGLN